MQYTGIQLSAITSLALLASASDGECDDSEMRIIFGHLGAYVPDEDQRKDLIAVALTIPFAEATAVVRQMTISQKRHFCAFIGVIILADGNITNSELEFWKNLSYAADLPIMSIQDAAVIFCDNMGLTQNSSSSFSSSTTSSSFSCSSSSGNSGCCLVFAVPILLISLITMSFSYFA